MVCVVGEKSRVDGEIWRFIKHWEELDGGAFREAGRLALREMVTFSVHAPADVWSSSLVYRAALGSWERGRGRR